MVQMIKLACDEETFSCSALFKLHKHFSHWRDSLEDDEHTTQPRTVRTGHKIKDLAKLSFVNRS
jgi:hypothetical protein